MEWRGRTTSWNWAAALTFGGWLAYRRLYGWATVWLVCATLLILLAITGTPVRLVLLGAAAAAYAFGRYGNALYRNAFRRAAVRVADRHRIHAERIQALRRAGGVDRWAVWLVAVTGVSVAACLVWFTRRLEVAQLNW